MGSSGLPRGGGISAGNNSSKSSRPVAFPMRHGPVAFPMRHGPPNLPRCGLPPASHVVVSSSSGNGGNAAPTPRAEAAKASSYPSTSSTPEAAHPLLSYETYEQGCDDDGEQQVCEDDGEQRRPSGCVALTRGIVLMVVVLMMVVFTRRRINIILKHLGRSRAIQGKCRIITVEHGGKKERKS